MFDRNGEGALKEGVPDGKGGFKDNYIYRDNSFEIFENFFCRISPFNDIFDSTALRLSPSNLRS